MNLDYLTNLNENQEEAVLHLNGPLLIVAGAGSGKTRVLTARIAHIVKQHKAFPNQILAVTFTNKAAKEMQLRVSKFLRKEATGLPWLGTFHSISAKILRKHAEAYKKEVVARAEGEASRFVSIYNEYAKAKEVTQERMYLETMEKVLADIDKVIIDKNAGSGVVPYLPLPELKKVN